jgi:hypothetical protein
MRPFPLFREVDRFNMNDMKRDRHILFFTED